MIDIYRDSEKKINQGWGHAETAQEDAYVFSNTMLPCIRHC